MARYLVRIDIETANPLMPIEGLVAVVRDSLLPSLEALMDLEGRGKVVTGGYPMGESFVVLVVEADSKEELQEVLDELPLSGVAKVKTTPLRSFQAFRNAQ